MKKWLFVLTLLPVVYISCQKEIKETIDLPNDIIAQENQRLSLVVTQQTQKTWLNGYIINESGLPVAGATVNCGGKTVITDAKGFYYFKEILTVNKDYALITVSKTGFRKGFRTFTPNRTKIAYHTEKIILQADGIPQSVPSTGGTVTAEGIKLTFPASSVVKPGGISYSGNIQVMIRYINPASANFSLMVPGMLSGLNSNGEINALQSLGMANVELKDPAGNKLEIAPGVTVKMEMPAPASGPATIPLWHFNENYGLWIQQGTANKVGNVYIAEVNHFSIWNIDLEFNDFELNLKFQTPTGSPVSNVRIDVYRPNNIYFSSFYTDNAGAATLINCPSSEALLLKMIFTCDTIMYTLAPVTQSRNETITVSLGTLYNLNGTLLNCASQSIPNQAFQIFLTAVQNPITLNGISDAQGHFSVSTILPGCQSGTFVAYTTAYFNSLYYKSSTVVIAAGVNSYSPKLCDTLGTGGGLFNDTDLVNIPDINLRQIVRQAINKPAGPIYYADVKNLNDLDAHSTSGFTIIQSMSGLQYFTGLDSLNISANDISDITPLQNLSNLVYLNLESNNISDITPLFNLTGLKALYLGLNLISNITPLQNLTSLDSLGIDNNQVVNLTPIQNMTLLKQLFLDGNQISNITPLQNLRNLRELHIGSNPLSNISTLQNLDSLNTLMIPHSQVSNLTPLQNLSVLRHLELHNNLITSMTPLVNGTPALIDLSIRLGNTITPAEQTAFQSTHPGCLLH